MLAACFLWPVTHEQVRIEMEVGRAHLLVSDAMGAVVELVAVFRMGEQTRRSRAHLRTPREVAFWR